MVKPFPLQTLLELSQLRMDESAKRLGELLAGEQEAGARLILLQQYRDEYNGRFVVAAQNGIGRDAWSNYQSFLARLDDAIMQAQAMVAQSKLRTADGQRELAVKHGKVKAFDTLSQRHRSRELGVENRKEQKMQDEHAARYFQPRDEEE
ncbi:MAG: flagellar export protein FliJ [Proteobacteria bacterium]|nr:flagellar export protein FliJ [Pseudomonadota bacterium]